MLEVGLFGSARRGAGAFSQGLFLAEEAGRQAGSLHLQMWAEPPGCGSAPPVLSALLLSLVSSWETSGVFFPCSSLAGKNRHA